jgi:hypothetical protein
MRKKNTTAYYDTESITAVKGFKVQALVVPTFKKRLDECYKTFLAQYKLQ